MFLKWIGIYDHDDDVPAQDDHECQAPVKVVQGFLTNSFLRQKDPL